MLNFEKAIKFQFEDKEWKKKLMPLMIFWGVLVFGYIFAFIMMYVIPIAFTGAGANDDAIGGAFMVSMLTFSCVFLLIWLAFILGTLYMSGYMFEIIQNIRFGKSEELPQNGKAGERISKGFKAVLAQIIPIIIMTVVYVAFMVVYFLIVGFAGSAGEELSGVLFLISIIVLFSFIGIWYLAMFVYGIFYVPISNYLFLTHGLSYSIFAYKEIIALSKLVWKELLMYFGIMFAGGTILAMTLYIPCVGIIAYPVAIIFLFNASAHLLGQTYAILDERKAKLK